MKTNRISGKWKSMGGIAVLALCCLVSSCTDTELVPSPWDNKLTLKGEMCTEKSDEFQLPIKVLFMVDVTSSMGYIDRSGQAHGNDPYQYRAQAVEKVIKDFCGQPNYSFSIIRFAEDVYNLSPLGPDGPEETTNGFMSCKDSADLSLKFANSFTKIRVADGWTPYINSLNLARRVIEDDIALLSEDDAAITRYIVIFFSDGEPCHIVQQDANWVAHGEDFEEIFDQLDRLIALEDEVGDIVFHTSYLLNPSGDECNNPWTQEISGPAELLQAMATRGGGVFKQFDSATEINFIDLVKGSLYRTYSLAYLIVTNQNARLGVVDDELYLLPDSDGDGLDDDAEEDIQHTDPLDPDTDHDGCRDGVEVLKGFWPLTGSADKPADRADPCGENPWDGERVDTDEDGLLDREELLVSMTNRSQADTDGDGLPDGIEVMANSNPHINDLHLPEDTDGDSISNWDEVKEHTLVQLNEEKIRTGAQPLFSYVYDITLLKDKRENGRKCYDYQVANISLVGNHANDNSFRRNNQQLPNTLDLYLVQEADGFGDSPYVFRKASYTQSFKAPRTRIPDRREIVVEQKDLYLVGTK